MIYSVIRPWKLHPDVQRTAQRVKSDPVMLYQKYKKEWKQVSFPGESRHTGVRWAVREKMLGTNPTPRVITLNFINYLFFFNIYNESCLYFAANFEEILQFNEH